jgi:Cd2+/Zn2+-exporting ATPase
MSKYSFIIRKRRRIMKEYRVEGLSCANCTLEMEKEIRSLKHGDTATLSYNSGKLRLDDNVSLEDVQRILRKDGAFLANPLVRPHSHDGHAQEEHSHEGHSHEDHEHRHGTTRRIVGLLAASTVLYLVALLAGEELAKSTEIVLYAIAAILSGYTTFLKGLKNLFRLKFNIDTLMTIALVGAASIGDWKEATLVAILFGLNELLEGMGMEKARKSMETLLQVAPKEAIKLEDGKEIVVPIDRLRAGDLVVVKPGGKIPSDGTVVHGRSSVNEAAVTGEPLPVDKAAGEPVFGGSVNNEGVLQVRIEKAYRDSSLAKIFHLVQEAQETKTPTELFINKFAKYYTPFIILVAVLVIVLPPLLLGGDWNHWLYEGLAVLIVGCPCALILSSPIALVSGITRNARNGILVKGGVFLELLGKLDTLAFDKTGTLTKGEPHVEKTVMYDKERFFEVAGAIERNSSHPLAQAVMKEVERQGLEIADADEIRTITGRGISATYRGKTYWLGNEKSLEHLTLPDRVQADIQSLKEQGLTLVLVGDADRVLGMFGIADQVREESRAVVAELHRIGIRRTVMLTGDHAKSAEKVAKAVGVSEYAANLLPEDKAARVKALASDGVAGMIGDGINDAPALASAQIGIAMGKGTDSAIETADVVLMQNHLGKLPEAIRIGRQVNRVIRFNLGVALGLKLLALLLTIPGWLTLWMAILSDMGATVFVTLVSLTILIQPKKEAG